MATNAPTRSSSLDLFVTLTAAELRAEREFSLVGLARWVLEPLSYMLVYAVLLGAILNRPRFAFPLFLLAALIPFRFFTESVFRGMGLVKSYSTIIENRSFPREILPLVVVGSNAATFLLAMLLFLPFMVVYDAPFTLALVWLPVVVALLLLLSAGATYVAAIFGLYFPDYRGVAQNLVRVTFFASTALVPLEEVPGDRLPTLIQANPLSSIFDGMRSVLLAGRPPEAFDLLYPLIVGGVLVVGGLGLYRWRQHEFAKEL
jgi:ABC-type polysaccharide/polyol phosphate export permease